MKHLPPNAYRVLGLPGEANWGEILRAAERLRGLESWGAWSSPWDMPMLGTVRREPSDIDAAMARLLDTPQRLIDRLLWFHERDAESAVTYLTAASIRDALEGWSTTTLPVAKHDAAVVSLLAAIVLDYDVEEPGLWARMLREWAETVGRDEYWLEVMRVEMDGGFDAPASLGELRDLRDTAIHHVAGILLARAREAILDGEGQVATRALSVLRDGLPTSVFDELCGELAAHLWGGAVATGSAWKPHGLERPGTHKPVEEKPVEEKPPVVTPVVEEPAVEEPAVEHPAVEKPTVEKAAFEAPAPAAEPPPRKIDRQAMSERLARLRAMGEAEHRGRTPATPPTPATTSIPVASTPAPTLDLAPPLPLAPPEPEAPLAHVTPPDPEPKLSEAPPERAPAPEPAEESPAPAALEPVRAETAETTPIEPTPIEPTHEPVPARRPLPRVPRRALVGMGLAAVIATLVLLIPGPRSSHPPSPVAATSPDPMLTTLFTRMETTDHAIARLMMDRTENETERAFLRRTIADYRTLLDDYHWRMERSLPYDPVGYRRVNGYLEDDLSRYGTASAEARAISDQFNALIQERARLVSQYNELVR